jgi:hypothetical protein
MGNFCLIIHSFCFFVYLLGFVFFLLSITGTVLIVIMVHTGTIPFAMVVPVHTEEEGGRVPALGENFVTFCP